MRHKKSRVRPAMPALRRTAAVMVAGIAAASSVSTASAATASVATAAHPVSHIVGPVVPTRDAPQHVVDGRRLLKNSVHRAVHAGPVAHGAGDSAAQTSAADAVDARVLHAFSIAEAQYGKPYVWGATGPYSFDCSGLTSYAYHLAGLSLPRTAAEQADYVHRIDRSQMKVGDLVFFYEGDHVYHVGLFDGYVGGVPYIVHAPHPGAVVRREAIWTDAWFPGTLR